MPGYSNFHGLIAIDKLVPQPEQLWHLVIAGFAATGFYEVWANWPTALVAGYPLEPPELIKSLFANQLGWTVPDVWAKALHYVTGVIFYPAGYWFCLQLVPLSRRLTGWIWGVVTYFIALGLWAPLAGLPFLLIGDNNRLSAMSLIGHAIFGYVLALVFEAFEDRLRSPD